MRKKAENEEPSKKAAINQMVTKNDKPSKTAVKEDFLALIKKRKALQQEDLQAKKPTYVNDSQTGMDEEEDAETSAVQIFPRSYFLLCLFSSLERFSPKYFIFCS